MGKGRRHQAGVPQAGTKAGIEFGDPWSAREAVDLLVGDIGAGEQRREFSHDVEGLVRRALPRAAVDRELMLAGRNGSRRPEHVERTEQADEFGRRIQRAGQVIGEEFQGRHVMDRLEQD
jgi:hypothetical protein